MTGRPLLGLLLALVAEGRHWTRLRWEFDDDTCSRTWQFTVLGMTAAAVLIWLDGNRYTALPTTLALMPALLVPMLFIQSYGLRESLPLDVFSFMARRQRERNRRIGLGGGTSTIHFGNVLFATSLVAAAVGRKSDTVIFLPGLVILTGWMLMSAGRGRARVVVPLMIATGLLGLGGRFALQKAGGQFDGKSRQGGFDPNHSSTLIGTAGAVRQSPEILWRLQAAPGNAIPRLLRTATYNMFLGASWRNQRLATADFKDLDTRLIDGMAYFLMPSAEAATHPETLPLFHMRGSAVAEAPLPLPGNATLLRDFALDGIEINSFGTVRVFPKHPVIEGTVFWQDASSADGPPLPHEDSHIPIIERETIRRVLAGLGIHAATPLETQLATLRTFFHQHFAYTRNPTIRRPVSQNGPTAIGRFLTTARAGHCEYFATAATLLLRENGVPARYATGYAVLERDPTRSQFVIRGIHGHSWCRVWDAARRTWIDFDPTPPDWLASVSATPPWSQRFSDMVKRTREDFFLWRQQPANRLKASAVMLVMGTAIAGFIIRRLWLSRRHIGTGDGSSMHTSPAPRTPLHALESQARQILGKRPPGRTYAQWLDGLRPVLPDQTVLAQAITLHQRLRFDPAAQPAEDYQHLSRLAARLTQDLKTSHGRNRTENLRL
jgi:hypothetical protein